MNALVASLQCCAFIFFASATVAITLLKTNVFHRVTAFIVASFIGLLAIIALFNFMRSAGVSGFVEQYEGYMEILIFPLALFSLYTIRNDISKQDLNKVQVENQLKATLLDTVSDVVCLHDFDGRIKYMNRTALHKLGFQKSDISTMHLSDIMDEQTATQLEIHMETLRNNQAATFESTLLAMDKTKVPVEVNARITAYNNVPHVLSVARDMTERNKLEEEKASITLRLQQAQKMESLGTLAGGIAHDFNNILVPILGYSDLLLDSFEKNTKEYESANKILHAAERARDIVKQILSFSRAKRETESAHPVFVHHVLKEVLELVREVLPRSATLQTRIVSCAPVISTASQIHRICLNLITNAYQALEDHPGTVSISLNEIEPPDPDDTVYSHWIELRVHDTGKGMTAAQQQRIFEPYYTTKKEGIGTGLGLSVVEGIVREIGGTITVQSKANEGTVFTVQLPGAHESVDTEDPPRLSYENLGGTLMVVDDEDMVGTYLKEILENAGYDVTLFHDSRDALRAFKQTPRKWQLVISDFTMPELTGDELAEEIRKINTQVGFLLCSGYSGQLDDAAYKRLRIDGFVLKPLRPMELLSKVQKVLVQKGFAK
ncbi:MAG: response regulator [Deltaproteobacteria bacterium]|nr:response regulator [Deltaproteobacteria bacterium]MBN2673139.1 response regulator [Deltaproteobacteria bacterium]